MAISTELYLASDEEFRRIIKRRTEDRMAKIDALPPALRSCVHDYGWHVVNSFIEAGVSNPRRIRHLVETVLNEFSPTRGPTSSQGTKADYHGLSKATPLARE